MLLLKGPAFTLVFSTIGIKVFYGAGFELWSDPGFAELQSNPH